MGNGNLTAIKPVRLTTINLSNNGVFTVKLPSQGGWLGVWLRCTDTLGTANPTAIALDNNLNQVTRYQLRANGRPVLDLPANDQYYRHKYLMGTIGDRVAPISGAGAQATHYWSQYIPLTLPFPSKYPNNYKTMFPAGLINNIEFQVTCPSSLLNATYTSGGVNGATFTAGPILSVSVVMLDLSAQELRDMVAAGGHGYIQNEFEQVVTASGQLDIELTSGRGALQDVYFRALDNITAPATAGSQTLVTDQKLILGNNEFPIDNAFLELQSQSKDQYHIENGGTNPGSSQLGGAYDPPGTWMYAFNRDGMLSEGLSLVNQPSLKLRNTIAIAPTGTSTLSVITGTIDPDFYKTII